MKMKDIFGEQGVKVGRDNTIIDPVDIGEWGDFAAHETAEAAAHAINNHDSLVSALRMIDEALSESDFYDSDVFDVIHKAIENED